MAMTREQVLEVVRKARDGLAALYGDRLKSVYLFGSYARDEADEDSDIDLAIVLRGPVDSSEERERADGVLSSLSLEYDCLLMAVYISEEEYRTAPRAIHRSIVREGVPV
jgi:type I restriction enzyme S subunit